MWKRRMDCWGAVVEECSRRWRVKSAREEAGGLTGGSELLQQGNGRPEEGESDGWVGGGDCLCYGVCSGWVSVGELLGKGQLDV